MSNAAYAYDISGGGDARFYLKNNFQYTTKLSAKYTENAFAWNTNYDTTTCITIIQPTNINDS